MGKKVRALDFWKPVLIGKKVLAKIYNSDSPYPGERDAFRPQEQSLSGDYRSWFDIMSERGFSATEIAETFAPDDIARRLPEFLEHGADAKELTKYMMSYRERYDGREETIYNKNTGDVTNVHSHVPRSLAEQVVRVYDKNHPGGRLINKEMMSEDGCDYVMLNLDILADNGVTEEDIINNAPTGIIMEPCDSNSFLGAMLECRKFDTAKVLELGFQRYLERVNTLHEAGIYNGNDVALRSDKNRYYAEAMKLFSNANMEYRDNFRQELRKYLEQVEEAERKGIEG